ncbi:hypothetical protein Tco_0152255 [Tanacetum coccineum]
MKFTTTNKACLRTKRIVFTMTSIVNSTLITYIPRSFYILLERKTRIINGGTWFWSAVFDTVLKSIELEAEAKCSLVLELEDVTLETQDAKPVVSESEDLSLLSQETKSLDTELVSK